MINQLLNSPYIEVPDAKWLNFNPKKVSSIFEGVGTAIGLYLMGLKMDAFIYNDELIDSKETLQNFIDKNIDLIEKDLVSQILFLIGVKYESDYKDYFSALNSLERFEKMSLIKRLEILDMTNYLSDRNLMDLFLYETMNRTDLVDRDEDWAKAVFIDINFEDWT